MTEINFLRIPEEYQTQVNQISDETIKKIYSKLSFLYLPSSLLFFCKNKINDDSNNNKNDKQIYIFLLNYFVDFKFIVYQIFKNNQSSTNPKSSIQFNLYELINITICIEGKCLVIEGINHEIIKNLFTVLKEKQISILNLSSSPYNDTENMNERQTKEEITNFLLYFRNYDIKKNHFIQNTISPIVGYLIRRYFYPTKYFKDQSFFIFNQQYSSVELKIKTKLSNFLLCDDINSISIYDLASTIRNNHEKAQLQNFQENDFIILRNVYVNSLANFYLVIHIDSLYIFMMKKMIYPNQNCKVFQREIYFCSNYSHRCLTHFYGFLKKQNQTIGFIYEFMCNGSLKTIIESNKNKLCEIYELMIINRIFQGIDYLHSNNLIHRDLKPLNILFDNNYIPYISDFETIRHPINEENELTETITNDVASTIYSSPEQYNGANVTYSSDIFSFGLIIYFIIEQKDLLTENISLCYPKIVSFINQKHVSSSLERIYQLFKDCIKLKLNERPNNKRIRNYIINEINSIDYLEKYFFEKKKDVNTTDICQFLFENMIFQVNDYKQINDFGLCLTFAKFLLGVIFEDDEATFIFELGNLYYDGSIVERDLQKAKKYYELAAQQNNSDALFNLGTLYYNGVGVKQDYHNAKKYYELSAQLNNSNALKNLGILYFNGYGVKQDYLNAKKFFELSAQQMNSKGLFYLGELYYKGYGVKQNYLMAKKYYELSAQQNNSDALLNLGTLYYYGHGVEQNYLEAKKYFELSAQQNNSNALLNIGVLYANGYGVKQNYLIAKKYYELSAKQNNSDALLNLGIFYYNGIGVPQDYSEAMIYFKLSAKYNNSDAFLYLGSLFFDGCGVKQDYLRAKDYFELSAKRNNSDALIRLGDLYYNGFGVKQDYLLAKNYYELSTMQNNPDSFIKLGDLYYNGYGVKKDYLKAKYYCELSAKYNNSSALFYLGEFFSTGEFFDIDIEKAIFYYKKCSEIHYGKIELISSIKSSIYQSYNKYCFRSSNNLGLIYLTVLNDLDNASKYLKEAGFSEYPFGQNNLGLLFELYLNHLGNAEYMFKRSASHKFALAEYNLAHFYEKNKESKKSIEFYIKASEHENEPLIFQNKQHFDKQLEISKTFIICYVNLKVSVYYLLHDDINESKKYFIRAFSKLISNKDYSFYIFKFCCPKEKFKVKFFYLKEFIINHPLFNLRNQPNNCKEVQNYFNDCTKTKKHIIRIKREANDLSIKMQNERNYIEDYLMCNSKKIEMESNKEGECILTDPGDVFDLAILNDFVKKRFIDNISDIVSFIDKILYTHPYLILFGRIDLRKPKQNSEEFVFRNSKNINNLFYEGFGIDI